MVILFLWEFTNVIPMGLFNIVVYGNVNPMGLFTVRVFDEWVFEKI